MRLSTILDMITGVIIIFGFFYIRLSNPSLTETELFLRFWPSYLLMTIAILLISLKSRD